MSSLKREIIIIDPMRVDTTHKRRVAAYCRVSSNSEDQLESFAAQVDYYTKLIAEQEDWQLVDIYADEGISALSTAKRDEFNRLMKDCRKGKIDVVLAKSISRFSRNTKDCLEHIRELKSLDISVKFEKENLDTTEMGSEMLLTMYSGMAQQESMSISGNMRLGCRMRMKNGTYVASSVPFGYDLINLELAINPQEAVVVKRIYNSYLSGEGYHEIAKQLTADGVPRKDGEMHWSMSAVRYILTNERYVGDTIHQKTYMTDILPFQGKRNHGELPRYFVADSHESIISKEDFAKAAALLENRQRQFEKPAEKEYAPLRYKIRCGECGGSYHRKIQNHKEYWICTTHNMDGQKCSITPIVVQELHKAFVRMYNKIRPSAQNVLGTMIDQLCALKASRNIGNPKVVEINQQLANLTEQNHVMNDLMVKSLIDSAFFISQTTELNRQILKLKRDKVKLMEQDDEDQLIDGIRSLLDIFEDSPPAIFAFDESLFEQMVEKIIIDSNEAIRFRLLGGLELPETIERGKRYCRSRESYHSDTV